MIKGILVLLLSICLSAEEGNHSGFGYPLNTQNVEYSPVISPNSRYIVFQSNRPGGKGGMDIWLSENKNFEDRTGKPEWAPPVNFKELNTGDFEGPFSILFDENGKPIEIYFTGRRESSIKRDGLEGLNIYLVKNLTRKNLSTDRWSKPEHLMRVNSNFDDKMPSISPDGKTLVFSSNRPGGYGGFDLWASSRDMKTDSWSEAVNLGSRANSGSNEIMPYYHYDGMALYFSSDRNDDNHKFHFYHASLEEPGLILSDEKAESVYEKRDRIPRISELKKLSRPYNSAFDDEGISFSHDGLWVYFASNRPGGEGQFDIYRASVSEELRKQYAYDFFGIVVDGSEKTMIGIDSTLKIYSGKGLVKVITSKRFGGDITSRETNPEEPVNFRTRILTEDIYRVEVSSPGFHPNQFTLDIRGGTGFRKKRYMKIVLMPVSDEDSEPAPPSKKTVNEPVEKVEIPPNVPKKKTVTTDETVNASVKEFTVKDADTKKFIKDSILILYAGQDKKGKELQRKSENFVLSEIPKEPFLLTAEAKGYLSETLSLSKDSTELKTKEPHIIYLKKKKSNDRIDSTVIYFEFNDSDIKDQEKKKLNSFASYLEKNKDMKIEIGGHTDNVAGIEFNKSLSLERALRVKAYLKAKGISETRMTTRPYWFSQPAASNDTEEGRAKNRRVGFKRAD
ncbi:MAG TPA: OmpA family protein [Leptospiraceae bacterium]|nr:OmpA family protein [Leptospiraceae bacterium]HMY67093.1 OmpA family protein [Leptospiraceae bacterium]HNF15287.1 OmpA family protein [Leptospiraceae bacterium]HNN04864.1 OmpA family protein [Leptospiraceae bacterium]